jgi:hypothetical protein
MRGAQASKELFSYVTVSPCPGTTSAADLHETAWTLHRRRRSGRVEPGERSCIKGTQRRILPRPSPRRRPGRSNLLPPHFGIPKVDKIPRIETELPSRPARAFSLKFRLRVVPRKKAFRGESITRDHSPWASPISSAIGRRASSCGNGRFLLHHAGVLEHVGPLAAGAGMAVLEVLAEVVGPVELFAGVALAEFVHIL